MTQTIIQDLNSFSQQEAYKQQRKQAKQLAKMHLKVEQAKWDMQKAEMKMGKARLEHEVAATRLRALEEELNRMQGMEQQTK